MAKPIVAIVGRPNVGKSQLFNRLAGKRLSIVEDTPGVTRDRLYADSDWRGRDFTVIDTGGIEPSNDNEILQFMRLQAETAISHADVIILITDLRTGVTAADQDVASMLLRSGKPIVLAVNKCDKPGDPPAEFYEFYNLGLGEPFGISALHGYGVGELLDAAYEHFPAADEEEEDTDRIRVALIGKPNVGKSSLLNRVLGEERVIVSNVAGTTRDAVEQTVRLGRHLLTPTEAEREELKRCLRDYEQCEADNGAGAQALRDTLIMQLLIRIRRMADNGDAAAQSEAHYDPKIAQVMSYINENLCGELSVDVLAERVFLSKYHFMRLFKAQTGVTVHTYVRQKRLVNAARLIREGTPAAKAAADSGFTDYSAFHRAFRESFGMSPGKLKK